MRLPLRLKAGHINRLRLEQIPAARRSNLVCPAGSEDTGWRITTLRCLEEPWQRLACAGFNPRTLADVLIVRHALPAVAEPLRGPLPRRWCGRDLRPWLTDAQARGELLRLLQPHRKAACKLLAMEFPDANASLLEVEEVVSCRAAELWQPWLRHRGLFCDVALESGLLMLREGHEPDREALTAMLLQEGDLGWLPLIARQPVELRLSWLRMLVETGRHRQAPPHSMRRLMETLRHAVERPLHARTAKICLMSLANGCTPRFVAMALRFHVRWKLDFQTLGRPAHEPAHRELNKVMQSGISNWVRKPQNLWRQATRLQDWSSAVRRLFHHPRPRGVHEAVLEAMQSIERRSRRKASKWPNWLAGWDDMLRELDATPRAKQPFALALIRAWRMDPEHDSMSLHSTRQLLRWLRRARDFEKLQDDSVAKIIEAVWNSLPEEDEETLPGLPESIWLQMRAGLVGYSACSNAMRGIWHARSLKRGVMAGMLASAPLEWLRTMRRIGELDWRERKELWQAFREHPLMSCDIGSMPLREALVLVDSIRDSHPRFPGVPEKLRAGAETMHAHVRAHYMEELGRNTQRLRLAVLDELAEWALWRRFPMLQGRTVNTHTLRVAAAAGEENRRPMRRLLRACGERQGTRAWSLAHPANERWLQAHPAERVAAWRDGFVIEKEIEGVGALRVGPEDDLQAILRMGTEFGTCLSAGCFNSFSTAANALDANKRVIYARDAQGRPWARQLLAIAESGHLVCFPVYSRKNHAVLRHLFAAYDHTLAQALRMPIWRSDDATAKITPLVCKDWYDDGAWKP
ncbi:MAG: hypothetical protein HS117_08960 [Verrucomicrobiaceae bacterium]|nr:hypothetical protein [Verrucomicrobiaceae bacterium]